MGDVNNDARHSQQGLTNNQNVASREQTTRSNTGSIGANMQSPTMNRSLFNIELTYIFDFYNIIKHSLDDINQNIYGSNLSVTNKETTTLEILNYKSKGINDDDDDDKYAVEEAEFDSNTEDLSNIDQRIYPREILTDQDDPSLYPSSGASNLNDEANGTHTDSVYLHQCIRRRPSEDCHFPDARFTFFPDKKQEDVIKILLKAQAEMDKIWSNIDKRYTKITITPKIRPQMIREFKREYDSYLSKEYPTQVKSVKDALLILRKSSFGILILNTKNQILAVQNYQGTWSAPKGHPKYKDDGTLEIPSETVSRESCEELLITCKRNKRKLTINKDNLDHFFGLNNDNFLECRFNDRPGTNDGLRQIGLFVVRVDETKWTFSLKDNKENRACEWLNIADIVRNKPEVGRDIYYTLRPFAQYLKDNPMP
ncbi:unnamed protein product [Adineta steineri]|uniref:Nudix hydrolase domain-containing protein n=1 Tax=Adineta steineri TaxID=433720 RepID=A0A813TX00_9BILA|nr:unnamed protein product [Adineta steineri]